MCRIGSHERAAHREARGVAQVVLRNDLAELLEPYAGHRYRVQYLVHAAGLSRPRRGPRLSLPTHLPARF